MAPDPHTKNQGYDVRPLVARASTRSAVWIFGIVLSSAAGLLFYGLEARRQNAVAPSVSRSAGETRVEIAAPPQLAIPLADEEANQSYHYTTLAGAILPSTYRNRSAQIITAPVGQYASPQADVPRPRLDQLPAQQSANEARQAPIPAAATIYTVPNGGPTSSAASDPMSKNERVLATRFQNPATTIPKGTLMQAVLETALDSTRAGFARAIISRDVASFDGSQVLIPSGSRLIGEYKADLTLGQKRALIQWQRLMRPDGAMIALDSPSADPLGRAGVKGKVSSHFLERFGGAILQSSLDIGAQVATNHIANGTVIYALPGTLRTAGGPVAEKVQPTLSVRQGTSVSVFVAKDLDFSTVAQ